MSNVQYSIFNPIRFRSSVLSPAVAVVLACVVAGSTQTAWALTKVEEKQAKVNFDEASNNKALTLDQFQRFIDLNAYANIGCAQRIHDNRNYDNAFLDMDANSDGKVVWSEYLNYENAQRIQSNRDYDTFPDRGANIESVVRQGEYDQYEQVPRRQNR